MSLLEIIVTVGITAAGALVHSSVGIGIGLVAVPALVAVDPAFAPGPLLLATQVISVRHIAAERSTIDTAALRLGLVGLPVGIIAAIVVLEMMSERWLAILVGSSTALAAATLLAGLSLARTPRAETVAGGLCAFAGLTAALPGPPLVCVYSDMRPNILRPTSGAMILAVGSIGFVSLLATGNFGSHEAELLLWLLPGVFAGLIAARWVRPYLDRPWFRPLVLTIALAGGLALVLRQVV